MAKYAATIIDGEFIKRRDEVEGDQESFSRAFTDWVMAGGEVGIWKFTKFEGLVGTNTTVVAFYTQRTYRNVRKNETVSAFWTITESWSTACCECGCSVCGTCQCCCESCDCGDCSCCCSCS